MKFFNIENIAFQVLDYPVSYVELLGTGFGLISIYYASRENILTWPTGIVNEVLLFVLFFQVQLYPDMFLQIYFLAVTLYGWYFWYAPSTKYKISMLNKKFKIIVGVVIIAGTLLSGLFFKNIHLYFPTYFKIEASYPFVDSFVMISSILATLLLAKKKIENWYLWILVDIVCFVLYFKKGIYFLSVEYLIFLGLASYGLYHWRERFHYD